MGVYNQVSQRKCHRCSAHSVGAKTYQPPDSHTLQQPGDCPVIGVLPLKGSIEERAQDLALYIIEHKATVRAAAVAFGVSKSTVHMELPKRNGIYGKFDDDDHNILWF